MKLRDKFTDLSTKQHNTTMNSLKLISTQLSILQWYSEETPYGNNKIETNCQSLPTTILNCNIT